MSSSADSQTAVSHRAVLFYIITAVIVSADFALLTAVIWASVEATGSALVAGVVIFLSTVVPFLLGKIAHRMGIGSDFSVKRLSFFRIAVCLAVVLAVILSGSVTSGLFAMIGFLIGVLNFLTQVGIEKLNARMIFLGFVDTKRGARFIQLCVQVSAFMGAATGGVLIDALDIAGAFLLLCTVSSIGTLIFLVLLTGSLSGEDLETDDAAAPDAVGPSHEIRFTRGIALIVAGMVLIGAHIGAFNGLLPILYQSGLGWSGSDYGLASAMAAVGAIAATFAPQDRRLCLLFAVCLVLADLIIVITGMRLASFLSTFTVGFVVSYTRISLRISVLSLAAPQAEKEKLLGTMVSGLMIAMGCLPLVQGALVELSGGGLVLAKSGFVAIALALTATILFSTLENTVREARTS
ncbi:MAG: hypothetical protein QNJ44_05575 [Rhodobacter sp.]|nr:hypothetical protein [Rhodobacter sp.]